MHYFIVSNGRKSGVLDVSGNTVIPLEKDTIQNIKGTNIIQIIDSNTKTSEIYNKKMEKVLELTDIRVYIKDNYLKVTSANGIAYLDYDGNKKDAKDIFTNNEIFAKEQNGKWGYVDKNGNTVVDFKYDMAIDLNEYGFGAVKQNGRWGVVDSKGNEVKAPTYELKFVDRQEKTNEQDVLIATQKQMEITYKYYQIALNNNVIETVDAYEDAQNIIYLHYYI